MVENDPTLADAARWFAAYRRGLMTAQELEAFRRWRADPTHDRAFSAVERAWTLAAPAPSAPATETPRTPRRRFVFGAIATACVIVASGLWLLRPPASPVETFSTAIGEQRTIALSDGSVVQLDAATTLQVRLRRRTREVVLEEGAALFDVAHDVHRPFTVEADGRFVRAIGTRFEVRRRAQGTRVAVAAGVVAVSTETGGQKLPGEAVRLSKGQALDYSRTVLGAVGTVPPERVGAWRDRVLELERATVEDLAVELARYYPVRVRVADAALAKRSAMIRLQMQDRDTTFASIEALLDIRLRAEAPGAYVIEAAAPAH